MINTLRLGILALISILSAGLALGLTFIPCYASLCSEDYFPLETRLHIGVFYAIISGISGGLLLRASNKSIRKFFDRKISPRIPVLDEYLSVGGLMLALLIIGGTAATTGYWLPAHDEFWGSKANPLGWNAARIRLTVTGVTGHYADILLGFLLIPVSRHNLLGQSLGIHQSHLTLAHKLIAYLFLATGLTHGVAYILHALDSGSNGDEAREHLFNTGNPTMSLEESALRSPWYATTAYTGGLALFFMVLLAATALPYVRRNHFNTFYYFHVASSLAIFIMASLHASTNFYLLLPGLLLWSVDWAQRFFNGRQEGLHVAQTALVEAAGHGWYRISLPAPTIADDSSATALEMGTFDSPLAYYYLNFPVISRTQSHPFTAATPSSGNTGPVFLFQPSQRKDHVKLEKEWTWKLASSVRASSYTCLEARVEGPYQPRATQFEVASHIICIVGGTGFTGAHSLAQWWLRARAPLDDSRFSFVWTVRQAEGAQLKEWSDLEQIAASNPRLALTTHVSSEKGRLDPLAQIRGCLGLTRGSTPAPYQHPQMKPSAWVYCAGPDSLIRSTHAACIQARQEISRTTKEEGHAPVGIIDWYMAKWDV